MELREIKEKNLPEAPGVYLFTKGKGRGKRVLYVGKATTLRDRVRSYFDPDLIVTRGPRIVDMVTEADDVSHEVTATVLEALVREAALIREYHPKANAIGKDDKSFLYACITREPVPRVLMLRGKDIDLKERRAGELTFSICHGPFTSGIQLREALRIIRRIFPFYDTPRPVGSVRQAEQKNMLSKHAKAHVEFNTQIGIYPRGVDEKTYKRNIRHVSLFLGGRVAELRKSLEREMKALAKVEAFEEASSVKRQLFALDHVQDVSLIKAEGEERDEAAKQVRIEAYDTAHIQGSNAYGVMTVLVGGVPDKKAYRTFKIKAETGKSKNDDIASLKEILERRLAHTEWPLPALFVIDGGQTHKKTAEKLLASLGIGIPVASVVKDEKHRPKGVYKARTIRIHDADIILANAEAHRFALATHKKARSRGLKK